MTTIGAVIIAKDEERVVARCVRSLSGLDQILVYDTGSADATPDAAAAAGAEVFRGYSDEPFHFARARNRAQRRCRTDWTLAIDCDEVIEDGAVDAMRDAVAGDRMNGYRATILHGTAKFMTVRLFRSRDWRWKYRVHNVLETIGVPKRLAPIAGLRIRHETETGRRAARSEQTLHLMLLALKETPEHFILHRHLAMAFLSRKENGRAAAHALKFVEAAQKEGLHPAEVSEGLSILGRAFLAEGHLKEALGAWGDAWKACPGRREPVWEAARALAAAGLHKEACWALEDLLAIPPGARPEYHFGWDHVWGDEPARFLEECRRTAADKGGSDGDQEPGLPDVREAHDPHGRVGDTAPGGPQKARS